MFQSHETALDMGNIVIKAFDGRDLVVATIDRHDVEFACVERSLKVKDQRAFIERNIDEFLKILWSKYVRGEGMSKERQGTKFTRVEFNENEIAKMVASSDPRPTVDEVLRARPVKGKIDYAELSREHIARYPKIRARLAE